MKISTLRKIYPYISESKKNLKWRPVTDAELKCATQDYQVLATCYEESVRHVLSLNDIGRSILKSRIKLSKDSLKEPSYKIKFNVNGKEEFYKADKSDYYGRYWDTYNEFYGGALALLADDVKRATLSAGIDISISKMIKKHPFLKPLISRLYMFPLIKNRRCEHNIPSNAFRWYTGKEPIVIGESEFALDMSKHKDKITEILDGYDAQKDCFVLLTGFHKVQDLDKWHCLPLISVDKDAKTVELLNKRFNTISVHSYQEIISKFKGLVGIRL